MPHDLSRRSLLRAGSVTALTAAMAASRIPRARHLAAQQATPPPVDAEPAGMDLVCGGGTLQTIGGEATFSLSIATMPPAFGASGPLGSFTVRERTSAGSTVLLEAYTLVRMEQLSEKATTGRSIVGWGMLGGSGQYPFILQVEDLGAPGEGKDTVNLVFGASAAPFLGGEAHLGCDCGGYSYELRSTVLTGDITVKTV